VQAAVIDLAPRRRIVAYPDLRAASMDGGEQPMRDGDWARFGLVRSGRARVTEVTPPAARCERSFVLSVAKKLCINWTRKAEFCTTHQTSQKKLRIQLQFEQRLSVNKRATVLSQS
jgi:hypothetical protein